MEIVIVSKGNNAVAYGAGAEIKKSSTSGICANLEALNEVLKTVVPKENAETIKIFTMDLIQGINSGYAKDYVKTGKRLDGKDIPAEELAGYKEFYELYRDRFMNLRFNAVSFIPRMQNNKEIMELRNKAYSILDAYEKTIVPSQTVTKTIDPDAEIRAIFDEKIKQALLEDNMEKYAILKAERDKLKQPEVVTVSGQQAKVETPSFEVGDDVDMDDIDKAIKNGNIKENNNDKPIEFEIENKNPNWDNSAQ